jgi:ABC-type glutathione transport system ATPase component
MPEPLREVRSRASPHANRQRSVFTMLASGAMSTRLLEVENLTKIFTTNPVPWKKERIKVLSDVTLHVEPGETLAVVGESGSGKTTLCRIVLGLIPQTSGRVTYRNRVMEELSSSERRRLRREIQAVFQDPIASFNPRQQLRVALRTPLEVHRIGTPAERTALVAEVADRVGIQPRLLARYPHQMSGGQRQRLAIARSLVLKPSLLVLDEPVSSLDVSVQAQILNLLKQLQSDLGLTYLFVTHNLGVVRYVADRIAVMYQGEVVEFGTAMEVLSAPKHAYTRALLNAVPRVRSGK